MPGVITGKHMLYDVSLTINTVDLSNRIEKITIMTKTNAFRGDAMGDVLKYEIPGLQEIEDIKLTAYQDYDVNKVYATLYAAWSVPQTTFLIVAKASSGSPSPTNPVWTIPCFVKSMPVMTGTHGDRHMADVTLGVNNSGGTFAVATA